jgi:hypothetical protein
MDQEPRIYTTQQENFKKMLRAQECKIANFDRQPALFNGVSMGEIT